MRCKRMAELEDDDCERAKLGYICRRRIQFSVDGWRCESGRSIVARWRRAIIMFGALWKCDIRNAVSDSLIKDLSMDAAI